MLTTTLSEVIIPAEIRGKAGLEAGRRFAATLAGDKIILTPLPRDPSLALRGAFAGKDSLTALLSAQRGEREHD